MSLASRLRTLTLALASLCALPLQADTIDVAVAANFTAPMKEIAAAFEREQGHQLRLAFGATGKFYAQIRHGAPFAVLLAADAATPARLAAEGAADADSAFTYAVGKLVLWSARADLVDGAGEVLRGDGFRRLALAEPKLAPYGAAALQTLQALGLDARLQPRLVYGESIGQTYQFAASGNAELGFVALSQVWHAGELRSGSLWEVPAALYEPIRQDVILLKAGEDQPAARALLAYLRSDSARSIIRAYGYGELP